MKNHQKNKGTTNENHREKLHFQYVSLFLSVVAIVISLLNGVDNYTLQKPKFSMEIISEDKVESNNANKIIKIYNTGGQIVNPKISARMQLKLFLQKVEFIEDDKIRLKRCIFPIEITNFFQQDPHFSYSNNSFVLYEENANEMFDFMDIFGDKLEDKGITCDFYCIQEFYSITYDDYYGKKKKRIFASGNNYDYWGREKGNRERFCQDIELIKLKEIPKAYMKTTMPLLDGSERTNQIIEDAVVYCEQYSSIQTTNVGDPVILPMKDELDEYIYNEYGLAEGIRVKRENNSLIGTVVIILFLVVIIKCIYCYRKFGTILHRK